MNFKKALILAPHTDDGELGCGATIHKLLQNNTQVYYAAFSTCQNSLPANLPANTLEIEVKEALTLLGIPLENILIFDFEVRNFSQQRQRILEEMVILKNNLNPDIVFLPSTTDLHQDHQVVHAEGLRAFKHTNLLGYEMPWNNLQFTSNTFSKVSTVNLNAKLAALAMYKSQANRTYLNKEFIYGLAKVRGVQAGIDYAEAFEAIRIVL